MKKLYLLFNHQLTPAQQKDALDSLKINEIINPPSSILSLWAQLPPSEAALAPFLEPVQNWLLDQASSGDTLLIQGDFGATYLMVDFARKHGLIPVYSTTERRAVEEMREDGSINIIHTFQHVRFRKYGM